ncbi:MAG TPA: hypothetical protein PK523_00185 [Elusimicrobiales bacterium]|nr:hypothetical protein [Elusimicrobiales bacterium]
MSVEQKSDKAVRRLSRFFKRGVSGMLGISIIFQNCAFAAGEAFEQLKRIALPDGDVDDVLVVPDPAAEELRLSFAGSVPRHLQDQIVALCLLAEDIVADPAGAGSRFSADPARYLAERGITDIKLDLDSREVKVVLALGDKRVRDAAMRGDAKRYMELLEERGLLDYNDMAAFGLRDKSEPPPQEENLAVVVPIVFLAVAYLEVAIVMHTYTVTYSGGKSLSSGRDMLNGIEGKVSALLWGREMARDMLSGYVAEKSEKWADAICELPAARERNLSKDQVKKVIEARMAEYLSE